MAAASQITAQQGATASATSRASIAQNFDSFLLLLTTQLKNQNPLEPLDTNEFTAQLVQFASVEQQLKSNETLTALLSSTQASTATNAATFIGKTITADGTTTRLGDDGATWRLNSPRAATQAIITIRDMTGNVVRTDQRPLVQGSQDYVWDGRTSTGSAAAPGDYTITVTAQDAGGQAVSVKTEVSGEVDGVDFSGTSPVLLVGNIRIPLAGVKSITR